MVKLKTQTSNYHQNKERDGVVLLTHPVPLKITCGSQKTTLLIVTNHFNFNSIIKKSAHFSTPSQFFLFCSSGKRHIASHFSVDPQQRRRERKARAKQALTPGGHSWKRFIEVWQSHTVEVASDGKINFLDSRNSSSQPTSAVVNCHH